MQDWQHGKFWVGAGVLAINLYRDGFTLDNSTNLVFFAVSFVPGVGWAISGVYFVVDTYSQVTTGKSATQNAYDSLLDKWIKFTRELELRIKRACMPPYF